MHTLFLLILVCGANLLVSAEQQPSTILLICDETHVNDWQRFADWKTKTGKRTIIKSVQELSKSYDAINVQWSIKQAIAEAITKNLCKWIILGGDSTPSGGLVPDQNTFHALYEQQYYIDIPTDAFYASPDHWNSNNDEFIGFWKHDKNNISYTGRAHIGRIPIRNSADIEAYTKKVIQYESQYPTDSYATKFLYSCAVPFADYKADIYWDKLLGKQWAGTCDKFFNGKSPWDQSQAGDFDLSATNISELINKQQYGKMHMHGHGLGHCWVMENDQLFDLETVTSLKNTSAYPIITTVSCFTGSFDNKKDPCISEAMLRQASGGAIAIIAPAREGVPAFPNWGQDPKDGVTQDGTTRLLTSFWTFGLTQQLSAGEALSAAKLSMSKDAHAHASYHWVCSELNFLGDPSLDMRPQAPSPYKLSIDLDTLKSGIPQTIEIKLDGVVSDMKICLWDERDFYRIISVKKNGTCTTELPALTKGTLHISSFGPSQNVKSKKLSIQQLVAE